MLTSTERITSQNLIKFQPIVSTSDNLLSNKFYSYCICDLSTRWIKVCGFSKTCQANDADRNKHTDTLRCVVIILLNEIFYPHYS
jgi:hypothetical protein